MARYLHAFDQISLQQGRVLHGNPFHGLKGRYTFPKIKIDDYAHDAAFNAALKKVKSSDAPALMFHHAYYPKMTAGRSIF
jgi:hypothetical protein